MTDVRLTAAQQAEMIRLTDQACDAYIAIRGILESAEPIPEPTPEPEPTPDPPEDLDDWPTAETTGVPDGTTLTPSGSFTVTEDGAVVEDLEITGRLTIEARNVAVRRCRIHATSRLGIHVDGGSVTVEDCEIVGDGKGTTSVGVGYANYTAIRTHIRGCQDGVKLGSNSHLHACLIEDLAKKSGSHNDGAQCTGDASNISVIGCRIYGPWQTSVSALKFSTNNGPISDVEVRDNYLSGGGYTIYCEDKEKGYGPPTDFAVVDNVIEAGSFVHDWRRVDHHESQTWSGNRVA